MSRRTIGKVLVGGGIALLLWAALAFTGASLGGPPEHLSFANRRPYNEVKRAAHAAFLPLVVRVSVGMCLLLGGARILGSEGES
jgi:hypothetical protein